MTAIDPVRLTADLIRCPSVTPDEGGALVLLEKLLSEAGFDCTRTDRGEVSNLFARWGEKGHPRTFGFNGHTDVVPVGDEIAWTKSPFGAQQAEDHSQYDCAPYGECEVQPARQVFKPLGRGRPQP